LEARRICEITRKSTISKARISAGLKAILCITHRVPVVYEEFAHLSRPGFEISEF
jgi:hypothetical protein